MEQFKLHTFLNFCGEVFHIARTNITTNDALVVHCHDYVEIFWIKEGKGIHLINGSEIPVAKGDLCMIRSDDYHTFKSSDKGNNFIVTNLAFKKGELNHLKSRYFPEENKYFWSKKRLPYKTRLTDAQLKQLWSLTDSLLYLPRNYIQFDFAMLQIFKMLLPGQIYQSALPHWLIFTIQNFNSPVYFRQGIKGFVELAGRSPDHINRILQKYMNQTLSETVSKAKLRYACHQLTMTNTPVKTIAYECGFKSTHYFYRLFRKFYNSTPIEYRKNNMKMF